MLSQNRHALQTDAGKLAKLTDKFAARTSAKWPVGMQKTGLEARILQAGCALRVQKKCANDLGWLV